MASDEGRTFKRGHSLGLGVGELIRAIQERRLDPLVATEDCLQRIADMDGDINAFVWVDAKGAIKTATERTRQIEGGVQVGPLHGLPIAVKELVDVAGAPSEYSSQARVGERADRDAAVVGLLRQAGAVVIGSTRSHEFGWGITTGHATRGGTRNPVALDRVPGGSSGGAAAAVRAGMVPACVATDTGGSIRIPSAFCGVAGIKPTYGTVPTSGVLPLAPSLDTIGVITRRVADLWPVLRVMQGAGRGHPSAGPVVDSLQGLRIGIAPRLANLVGTATRVGSYEGALAACARADVQLIELATPSAEEFRAVFAIVQGFEALQTHTKTLGLYPGRMSSYGADVAARLAWASTITEPEYDAASREAKQLTATLASSLLDVEAMLTPVALVPPPFLDSPDFVSIEGRRIATRDAVMGFTVPQNVARLPTVAFRAGLAADGLPFGLQLSTMPGQDQEAINIADLLERLLDQPAAL